MVTEIWWGSQSQRGDTKDQRGGWRVVIKWISQKKDVGIWIELKWLNAQ